MSPRCYAALAAAALIAPAVADAQSETRASIDVAPGVGYSSNPFSGTGSDLGAAYAGLDITPSLSVSTARNTLAVTGSASLQQYFTRYSDNTSYRVSADYAGRPSERVTTHLRMDISSSIIGGYDSFANGVIQPGGPTVPSPTDLGLFGSRDRRRGAYATGDISVALSQHDSVNASAFYEAARYRRFADIANYDGMGGTLGYNRQLSANTRIGLQGTVSRYDYPGARGQSTVYTVNATGSTKLSQFWTIDGAIGMSFVNSTTIGSTNAASLSGSANLCRQGELSTFCLNGSRSVRPTGLNGTQYVTLAGASWSRRLSSVDSVSLRASYTMENGSRAIVLPGLRAQYLATSASYERRLSERLRFTASAQYRDIFTSNLNRPADFGGRIGISYRFGDLK